MQVAEAPAGQLVDAGPPALDPLVVAELGLVGDRGDDDAARVAARGRPYRELGGLAR
ncbi:hypothetical protein AB0K48_54470 [Nonomuraea sp. NPDC055795]